MDNKFNIMGIDPGSRNVGIAIYTIETAIINDSITFDISNINTYNIAVDVEDDRGIHDVLLDRTSRISKIIKCLYKMYNPAMVGIETSFVNLSRMSAVIPLSRAIQTIETALYYVDKYVKVINMTPGVIKKAFNSKQVGKDAVLVALKNKPDLYKKVSNKVSDHEVDGIAIAYALLEYIKTTEGMLCIKYLEI